MDKYPWQELSESNPHEIQLKLPGNPLKCPLKEPTKPILSGDAADDAAKKEKAQIEAALTEARHFFHGFGSKAWWQ